MKNQLEPEASDLLGVPYVKLSRRDELQKGVRLHAEHWKYTDFPKFQPGDIVWTYGSPNVAQTVITEAFNAEITTETGAYHVLNIEYFVLQPDEITHEQKLIELAHKVNHARKVDFEMLKGMIRHRGTTPALAALYFSPSQTELANLELFLEIMGKSSTFAHKAHKQLKP